MLPNALEQHETQTQIPYAIAKLEESARTVRQAINELPLLRRRLEKNKDDKAKARDVYSDMQSQHRRLMGALDTSALSLLEAEQDNLASHSVKLSQSIKSFNLLTPDFTKLCTVLGNYLTRFPLPDTSEEDTDSEAKTTNNRIIGRLMNNVKMGYFPTCPENLAHITRGVEFTADVTTNLLDPCCGCGLALRSMAVVALANGCDCKTYGIELDSYRAEEAQSRLDRVGFGSFFHSRISNEAFHALLLNPPYLWTLTQGGNNTRSEKRFLVDSISNIMLGGLLVYIIPHYRMTADICRVLCDNFTDISMWKFTGAEYGRFKQVAVMGIRQKRRDGSALVPELTELVLVPDKIPELTELPAGRYQLPNTVKEVALFKGALFNESELAEQLSRSNSFSRLFERSKLDNITKRPLLPLSIGQIGLVGGSGLINGLVECDTPHIIKGRIVKEKRIRTDENTNSRGDLMSTTQTEVISNKLVFNLLTPKGFISLTDYKDSGTVVSSDNAPSDENNSRSGHSHVCTSDATDVQTSTHDTTYLPMGRIAITANAKQVLNPTDINISLARHSKFDWGDVSEADKRANNGAVKHGERVISAYEDINGTKFWIITERDRSYTTVLLPEDY